MGRRLGDLNLLAGHFDDFDDIGERGGLNLLAGGSAILAKLTNAAALALGVVAGGKCGGTGFECYKNHRAREGGGGGVGRLGGAKGPKCMFSERDNVAVLREE